MVLRRMVGLALVVLGILGCSKESLLRGELEDPADRKETLELTLKIFDEHPEYVDDLFVLAKEHDATFNRLVELVAVALEDEAFAANVAENVSKHPKAVELITRAILIKARENPELRTALASALLAESDVMNMIIAENPALVRKVLSGSNP